MDSWALARDLAARCCEDCGWYHGFWQYLRLMGMGKTLSGQSDWFLEKIRECDGPRPPSILISGCADYSAFAHVIAALRLADRNAADLPRIVAVDRCRTPLELNAYLSTRTGIPITTVKADILTFSSGEKFDLIFTSSFLGFFDPQARKALFRKYRELLAPGRLVFANRRREGDESIQAVPSASAIEQAVSEGSRLHQALQLPGKMDEQDFVGRLREFMRQNANYPLNSRTTLAAYLGHGGYENFSITESEPTLPQTGTTVRLAGASLAEKAPYLCVVATR